MQEALSSRFSPFANMTELRIAVEEICSEFGRITEFEILTEPTSSGMQCACYLRLKTPKAENALLKRYRAARSSGYIYFNTHIAGG